MQAVFAVVLPVFGLIFTGLLAGRFGVLDQVSGMRDPYRHRAARLRPCRGHLGTKP